MARIDYAISVTPIQASQYDVTYDSAEAGTSTTNTDIDYVDPEVGRALGGGNSSKQWDGSAIDVWAAGVPEHIEAHSTPQAVGASGDDMIWIKHSGKRYDSSTSDNLKADGTEDLTTVVVYVAVTHTLFNGGAGESASGTSNIAIAKLEAGECMVIPESQLGILVGSADTSGAAPAVEYCKLT